MADEHNVVDSRLEKLDERVAKLSEDVASQKSVGELIKYLVYFWAAISAALGLFGWSKFSDIDKSIEQQVQLQLPRDKQEFATFSAMVVDAEELNKKYKALAKDYEDSAAALQLARTIGVDFDIEGKLNTLIAESAKRPLLDEEKTDVKGTILEPAWRKEAIATISIFTDSLAKKSYPAGFIFNVTQICRRLDQFQLAERLTKAAYEKDASPPIRALYYSSLVQNSTGASRDEAFNKLMAMVETLPEYSPEIIVAEAWNAAENQRRYGELIGAIDNLASKRKAPPSYVFVIKAQALMRQSEPGSIVKAKESLATAKNLLSDETALASWFESTVTEYASTMNVITKTEALPGLLAVAVDHRKSE